MSLNTADEPKPKNGPSNDHFGQFQLLAISSCAVALFSVLILAISLPILCSQLDSEHSFISAKSEKFKVNFNRIWARLHSSAVNEPRNKRSDSAGSDPRAFSSACGCSMLNCPQGPPGPAGSSGQDSPPGQAGNPGESGEDGLDIVMESELDFPCIVCPGGPPGQRGTQGERGMPGHVGSRGEEGIPGKEGTPGPRGLGGLRGNFGPKGTTGLVGIRGDQVVAGVGGQGPKGRLGPAGPMGPLGLPGRTGEQGPPGQKGDIGRQGELGDGGQSGEPGIPSAFCPSDCGVSHIKVPGSETGEESKEKEQRKTASEGTVVMNEVPKASGRQHGQAQLLREGESREIRRHPTGGYYRKRQNGEN
uniref:Nematode cuticle collagen N-terminal domain-containing protein n=1 Tax=Globodera rostochiensis TaxID=31243 RepID=A0A914GWI8_GLORO